MENKKDSPGVYIPPPLFYILIFFASLFLQKQFFIDDAPFHNPFAKIIGAFLIATASFFLFTSLRTFLRTRNTLILIKPATSLQTGGIYRISRNPMYVGLAFLYLGISCLAGNWWNMILFPFLIIVVGAFVIGPEERYLARRFGQAYTDYKMTVHRWL